MTRMMRTLAALAIGGLAISSAAQMSDTPTSPLGEESQQQRDLRMQWWREARFGLFIHWGLYAIPAGQWGEQTHHGEWIMNTAHIPLERYEQFVAQFNPVKFDADRWAQIAKDAGMKYIVITSKHHDGFCLFDSAQTDYDVMSTPFKRDIMKELSEACRRHGLKMCWYHSIMDWHHPDYLPRRDWEERSAEGADFERFRTYLKSQVRELLTDYGEIGVMWFDGEWEATWNHEYGADLYNYVRGLRPDVIVNNRVDKGRGGMAGMTKDRRFTGDFGTPEQEIPTTGLPGVDWETCMTMNHHWGYNRLDDDWKSTEDLIRKLADIASKGGNFLLNVGPKADGTFPQESVDRLRAIGAWMKVNGESIYGTSASPFKSLPWGRCTQKRLPTGDTRLYLHVFDWPAAGDLTVPGIFNEARQAYLMANGDDEKLYVRRKDDALIIRLPADALDPIDTVVVLDVAGKADVADPPVISAPADIFVDTLEVTVSSDREKVVLRYTTDGSEPTPESPLVSGPIRLTQTATVTARVFRADRAVSGVSNTTFTKVVPQPAVTVPDTVAGVNYEYYEGEWDRLPDFDALTPVKTGTLDGFLFSPCERNERFGFRYTAYVRVPTSGVYTFYTLSDDGSRLYIGDELVVDNDGLHSLHEASGRIALDAGLHTITVTFFERTGGDGLEVTYAGPGIKKQRVPSRALFRSPTAAMLVPHPRQMAWQEMEVHAFVHFGINTFTDREWGDGTESPTLLNPTELDANQWVRDFKDAGMKQVVLSAKHHDGFCLWPSAYTEHSVKNSPWRDGRGDLVREVADACHAAGLKLGIYLSPWDRHEPTYGDSPRYNEHYKNQLRELLSNYGPIHEVWFDGACGEGPNGKKQVYDWDGYVALIRELQPDAVIFSDAGPDIRWVGNEQGFAGETNWSMLRRDEFYPGTPKHKQLTEGHEDGTHWVPAECDVSIRPGWFYHAGQDDQVKTVPQLVDLYYQSVGRNGVLLLNVPPDRRGLIHKADAARLHAFGEVISETFRHNLAAGKPATATSGQTPASAVDDDPHTCWAAAADDSAPVLTIDLGNAATFDRIALQEDIRQGQRVRAFAVEVWSGQDWDNVATGTTIGYKRLLRIDPVAATRLRLVIRDMRAAPMISEIGLYKASPRERLAG